MGSLPSCLWPLFSYVRLWSGRRGSVKDFVDPTVLEKGVVAFFLADSPLPIIAEKAAQELPPEWRADLGAVLVKLSSALV